MEHATVSMRNDAEHLSETHPLIAEILPELQRAEMQTAYFQSCRTFPEVC
jgi:hypothetical protein